MTCPSRPSGIFFPAIICGVRIFIVINGKKGTRRIFSGIRGSCPGHLGWIHTGFLFRMFRISRCRNTFTGVIGKDCRSFEEITNSLDYFNFPDVRMPDLLFIFIPHIYKIFADKGYSQHFNLILKVKGTSCFSQQRFHRFHNIFKTAVRIIPEVIFLIFRGFQSALNIK